MRACDYCAIRFEPSSKTNTYCSRQCKSDMDSLAANYTPLDEFLARPRSRILRAMRWTGWLAPREIAELLGVTVVDCKHDLARDCHDQALVRLRAEGLVQSRREKSLEDKPNRAKEHTVYRLTRRGVREADRVRFGIKTSRAA